MVVDEGGVIRAANAAALHLFRAEEDGLAGAQVDDLVPEAHRDRHADHRESYLHDPLPRPMGTDLQLSAVRRDGTSFRAEISLSPVRLERRLYVIAAVRDVTERQHTRAHLALLHDRERIARDLHDRVIQRIYATGMALQAIVPLVGDEIPRERISAAVDELDGTIGELRSAIFGLGATPGDAPVTQQIMTIVAERSSALGFTPSVVTEGDTGSVPAGTTEHVVATCSEALSNVARHADATAVSVRLSVTPRQITLVVHDNGRGIVETRRRRGGIANMSWRAAELGGSCEIDSAPGEGTTVRWTIPIDSTL